MIVQGWPWAVGVAVVFALLAAGGWWQRRSSIEPAPESPSEPLPTDQERSLEEELQQLNQQLTAALQTNADHAKRETELQAQLTDAQEEAELLLLQLHQVQEELEHYFLLSQSLEEQQRNSVEPAAPAVAVEPDSSQLTALRERLADLLQRRHARDQELERLLHQQQKALQRASHAMQRAQSQLKAGAKAKALLSAQGSGEIVFL